MTEPQAVDPDRHTTIAPILHRPELLALATRYALAADHCDADAFADVFEPDGVLRLADQFGSGPASVRGHAELATVPRALERYVKTLHILGTAGYSPGDDTATGEVYCVAHHLKDVGGALSDHVMYIRYTDAYRRDMTGMWRIVERVVHVDWSERKPVEPRR